MNNSLNKQITVRTKIDSNLDVIINKDSEL